MIEKDYRDYFSQPYKGIKDLVTKVLNPIFGSTPTGRSETNYATKQEYVKYAQIANISNIQDYGEYNKGLVHIRVWDITLNNNCNIERSRVGIQDVVRTLMEPYSGHIIVFHYDANHADETWRISWVEKTDTAKNTTPAKRYTYLCGPSYSCRTIAKRFEVLENVPNKSLSNITEAFSVEALSDEFFYNYRALYSKIILEGEKNKTSYTRYKEEKDIPENELGFCDYLFRHKNNTTCFGHEFFSYEDKTCRDYVKKLLGRLVFLQFLQKKGWMCNIKDLFENYITSQNENTDDTQPGSFLENVLKPLFFGILNTEETNRAQLFKTKNWDCKLLNTFKDIPYLNGGLFEQEEYDKPLSSFPNILFKELFDFFDRYNFTIDENDPYDAEVGVDPEMLGKIFESLLEDNKDKGAFYTPKEIVQYMCRESLIAYLQTDLQSDDDKQQIRDFVTLHNASKLELDKKDINEKLCSVKICDPAIGSGAFPMGLLNELVACREALDDSQNRAKLKKEIIQNNIYGVDIEKGAVDIARLRFWLSIVVDLDKAEPLPNFDYKFMQGNSLLESYFMPSDSKSKNSKGNTIDLSRLSIESEQKRKKNNSCQTCLVFDEKHALINIQACMKRYFALHGQEKEECKEQINQAVKDYISCITEGNSQRTDLLEINPSANEKYFLWHLWFKDVFGEWDETNKKWTKGFDIVIGNPPYIRHEKMDINYKHLLCSIYPNVGEGTADILVYFFGLGIGLLASKGILNFITSNKFLKTKYGTRLRNTLANDVDVLTFIDFFELPVFTNASTDAGITLLRKDRPITETKYFPVLTLEGLDLDRLTKGNYQYTIKTETEWQFIRKEEYSILQKLNSNSVPLTQYVDNRIYSGVKTGLNDTFMLSADVRERILANCKNAEEYIRTDKIIKKAFKSRDIRKYKYIGSPTWLLYIPWHFPLPFEEAENMQPQVALKLAEDKIKEDYPSLYSYLCENKEELSDRNKEETGIRYEWYALQRWGAKYYSEFDEEKLIYIHTAKNHEFYYDTEKHYVNNSCYIIATKSKFLYCFLNSKLFSYFKQIKFVAYGNGAEAGRCKLDGNKMATVPIRTNVDEAVFEQKFEEVQTLIKQNPQADTSALEVKIDELVYQLYNITSYEELKIIEGSKESALQMMALMDIYNHPSSKENDIIQRIMNDVKNDKTAVDDRVTDNNVKQALDALVKLGAITKTSNTYKWA